MTDANSDNGATDQYLEKQVKIDGPLHDHTLAYLHIEHFDESTTLSHHLPYDGWYPFSTFPFVTEGYVPLEIQGQLLDEYVQAYIADEFREPSDLSFNLLWFRSRNWATLGYWWDMMTEEMKIKMAQEHPGMFVGLDEGYRTREPRNEEGRAHLEAATQRLRAAIDEYKSREG